MEYRTILSMGNIFIFDIDGCIMPDIFPNIKEVKNDNKAINHEIKKKSSSISLFPEFIEFYKSNCLESLAVYFLTGRKQKYYGKITETQLKPIKIFKDYIIKYFPDNRALILEEYLQWKAKNIKDIMNQWFQDSVRFHIYDDLNDLFLRISREISPILREYNFKLIRKQADWVHKVKVET